jgi:hypothetical protein
VVDSERLVDRTVQVRPFEVFDAGAGDSFREEFSVLLARKWAAKSRKVARLGEGKYII